MWFPRQGGSSEHGLEVHVTRRRRFCASSSRKCDSGINVDTCASDMSQQKESEAMQAMQRQPRRPQAADVGIEPLQSSGEAHEAQLLDQQHHEHGRQAASKPLAEVGGSSLVGKEDLDTKRLQDMPKFLESLSRAS